MHSNSFSPEQSGRGIDGIEGFTVREQLSKEVLKKNQDFFNWLELDYNLTEEIEKKGIALLSQEQKELGEKLGYTLTLIIPGNLSGETLLEAIDQKIIYDCKIIREFASNDGIDYHNFDKQKLFADKKIRSKNRPAKPYEILVKPDVDIYDAHPETLTLEKTFSECQEILDESNQKHSGLNLRGFNLEEYAIFQAFIYYDGPKDPFHENHPEKGEQDATWLLDEQSTIKDDTEKPQQCLTGTWNDIAGEIVIEYGSSMDTGSWLGCRYIVCPKNQIS